MAKRPVIIAVGLVLSRPARWISRVAFRGGGPIVGVVRVTEIRWRPSGAGSSTSIKVGKGDQVRAGDVVAELSDAGAGGSCAQARRPSTPRRRHRDHIYAGVRAEEIASLAPRLPRRRQILSMAQAQLTCTATLAQSN